MKMQYSMTMSTAMDALFCFPSCLVLMVCFSTVPACTCLAGTFCTSCLSNSNSSFRSFGAGGQGVLGVNYGMLGDNLPAPADVVALCKSNNIRRLRLFDPNPEALKALEGSGIEVVLGTFNQDVSSIAKDVTAAARWAQRHVIPYARSINFRYISLGNEVIPGDMANDVLSSMKNLQAALLAAGISLPITTTVSMAVLGSSYPPSNGSFSPEALPALAAIAGFLEANNAPLLLNAYPYFAYIDDRTNVELNYALGSSTIPALQDGAFCYFKLLDAMVDAAYAALEKVGAPGVEVVVTETGWPSGGGDGSTETVANAQKYNKAVATKVHGCEGTPRRPEKGLEVYLFAMFNEDRKAQGTEQHFGLFYPNMTAVYTLLDNIVIREA